MNQHCQIRFRLAKIETCIQKTVRRQREKHTRLLVGLGLAASQRGENKNASLEHAEATADGLSLRAEHVRDSGEEAKTHFPGS